MKTKIILTAALILSTWISQAQNQYKLLENLKHTTETVITPEMFELIADIDYESEEESVNALDNLITSLSEIRIYMTEDKESASKINQFFTTHVETKNMTKLMHVKEENEFFSFHILRDKENKVKDLVLLVNEMGDTMQETVLILISGNLDMKQIGKLTDFMDMPGGDQLKEASEGK